MNRVTNVYQQAQSNQLGQKELVTNIWRVLGKDPRKLEFLVQPQHAKIGSSDQQNVIESPVLPVSVPKKQSKVTRFARVVRQAATTTWTTLTPFLRKQRAEQGNQR